MNAQAALAKPNKKSDGTRMSPLPKRSASTPSTGARNTPGKVKKVISNPTRSEVMFSSFITRGKAGVILDTPQPSR